MTNRKIMKKIALILILVISGIFISLFTHSQKAMISEKLKSHKPAEEKCTCGHDHGHEHGHGSHEGAHDTEKGAEGNPELAHEHSNQDFLFHDFFNEPWRSWASTYIVWEKVRNLFLIFALILLLRPVINRFLDYINILNLRLKGIRTGPTGERDGDEKND